MDSETAASPGIAPPSLPRFTHKQILRVIFGILLCILLAALDQTVVIPAVPAIAADLRGFGHLSWIVSAYLLTSTASTPIYGKLSDTYGRRLLLLPALALFALASVLCGFARSLDQLILFRALQGIGGGGLMAMAQAAIADVVAPRERGRYQAYMASAWGVASIAGPIVGGWMTDALSWRWIFWINLPIALVAMVLCDRALRLLTPRRLPARIDWLGAFLLTAAVSCYLLVLSWGGVELAWTAPLMLGLIAAGVALLALLAVHERRDSDPLLPPRVFANPVFRRGVTLAFFASLAMFGATFLLPLFFQLVGGADAGASGVLVVPFLASSCVGAYVAGSAARRMGRLKPIMLIGLAVCIIGFLLLATMGPDTPPALAVVYQLIVGTAIGTLMPSSMVAVQNAADLRDVGVATGCLLFLRSLGGAFGTTLVGAVVTGRFHQKLADMGVTARIDLGTVRDKAALAGLDPAVRHALPDTLAGGFHLAFLACAALLGVAMVVAAGLRDLPLRSSDEPAEPAMLAH